MQQTATLAGYFAAHAVWCVEDGETLIPMLAVQKPDGSQEMHRMVADTFEEGVARGQEWLESNHLGATRAVLIYDGYITLPSGKLDALLVEGRAYGPPVQSFVVAVPYRHAHSPAGFAVHRTKLLEATGDDEQATALMQAFFDGASQHEQGYEVWSARLDESV